MENRAATGAPTISGLPAVGHRLSAGIAGIADEDGLPSSFTYQWLQVDADGTSNEEAISGANAATYTVAATDVGKRVKVRVSFIDSLGGGETLTSDAFPLSGTVYMAVVPGAPQNITASTANTRVVLGWEAPANDGGAPITKYQYRASADSGTSWSSRLDRRGGRERRRLRRLRREGRHGDRAHQRHRLHLRGARGEQRGRRRGGHGHGQSSAVCAAPELRHPAQLLDRHGGGGGGQIRSNFLATALHHSRSRQPCGQYLLRRCERYTVDLAGVGHWQRNNK